jgi:metallo-beta-lactamase family protein
MEVQFLGAAREVTGSCYLFQVGGRRFLVDCGLIQGSFEHEQKNREPFPFDPRKIDAVVLTHAHLDHSGRLPMLIRDGFRGFIYTHRATAALCRIMLEDAAYLNEKEAERYNHYRAHNGKEPIAALYTADDVYTTERHFQPLSYGEWTEILPGVELALHDAGHILGSAIVELELKEEGCSRRVVMSGDLGHSGAPILDDPAVLTQADLVVLESTYGDRAHRPWDATWAELGEIIQRAHSGRGNILVPAFAVGRTQELLYVLARHHQAWGLDEWYVFLDSPMAIETTELYRKYSGLYDKAARAVNEHGDPFTMRNLMLTRTAEDSMRINDIRAGAIIIAGSGMCTGGRIVHHLKRNLAYEQCHVVIVGFQALGTLGRALVDGATTVRLFGEDIPVRAQIHTVGGLSAHADQAGLAAWYANFANRPPVALVHGEPEAMDALAQHLRDKFGARVTCPQLGQRISLTEP